ncbi:MAG: hypothetical protein ACE362_17370 [Phaeodactylibacter xiamenensis]|uniref:BioF2-like acetyltransferase domain-containing protein n=1 Tax=Phaeodactylibacter xiamenensis TaxID=1524460 RepID=A0A098S9S2_9BACT|nr:hypothetical protein [Phaeodactylibacter xiamenensis]KGE88403.1 hypothetical protein IX84_09430 [Phaeodactylibacter xiamenensis]MCR9051720.1 hypothetical protein [bacterium]
MEIKFVPRGEIDKVKWNSCVHYATNGNIFGYMWYLDHIAKDWDALVEGDYESVFPLVWRLGRISGKELHQPALIRELGIYSIHVLSKPRVERFLAAIPEQYQHISIYLNEQNPIPDGSRFKVEKQTNYQLFLNRAYEEITDGYSRPLMEKLQLAEDAGLVLTSSMKPEQIAGFYKKYRPRRQQSEEVFHGMQRVMYNALHRGWGFASSVLDTDANPLAVNFFLYSHGKVISFMPVVSPEGKAVGALPHLFNGLVRQHAGRPVILDFNVSGNNQMAIDFGAKTNPFFKIQLNKRRFIWF